MHSQAGGGKSIGVRRDLGESCNSSRRGVSVDAIGSVIGAIFGVVGGTSLGSLREVGTKCHSCA